MRLRVPRVREAFHRENVDRLAEHALAALPGPFLPWSRFAMRPAGLLAVLNDIWLQERRSVVECGGGISTIYIARLLRQLGRGRLITLEHDDDWLCRLSRAIDAEDLGDLVTVVKAPLCDTAHGRWYDTSMLPNVDSIDLLVVDGPPAYAPGLGEARYPALPFFATRLAPGATVILDDIMRPGEKSVAARWERELPIRFTRHITEGAVAIGRFGDSSSGG